MVFFFLIFPAVAKSQWILNSNRDWLIKIDANDDGKFEFIDLITNIDLIFFWPGDFVLSILIPTDLGQRLHITPSDFHGSTSLVLSILIWIISCAYLKLFKTFIFTEIIDGILQKSKTSLTRLNMKVVTKLQLSLPFQIIKKITVLVVSAVFLFLVLLAYDLIQSERSFLADMELNQSSGLPSGIYLTSKSHETWDYDKESSNFKEETKQSVIVIDAEKPLIKPDQIFDETLLEEIAATKGMPLYDESEKEIIDSHMSKIANSIKSKISFPFPILGDGVLCKVLVTQSGVVLKIKVLRGSGNDAYDSAVERAILKAQPLPMPTDEKIYQDHFRSFNLTFSSD